MPLLSDQQITQLRDAGTSIMNSSCVIYRNSGTADGYLGIVDSPTNQGTVICYVTRMGLITPALRARGEQQVPDATWHIRMPNGTDVQDHDVIVWDEGTATVVQPLQRTTEIMRRVVAYNTTDFTPP